MAGAEPGQDSVPPNLRHSLAPSGSTAVADSPSVPREMCHSPAHTLPPGSVGRSETIVWEGHRMSCSCGMLGSCSSSPCPFLSPSCGVCCLPDIHVAQGDCQAPLPVPGCAGWGREKGCQPRDHCWRSGHPRELGTAQALIPSAPQTGRHSKISSWRDGGLQPGKRPSEPSHGRPGMQMPTLRHPASPAWPNRQQLCHWQARPRQELCLTALATTLF